ncbi:glycosyltransferase [Williamsia deligens]|uniref:Glycosyltransferase n=1 Tax=Williamsia deligens TaxID=321325 RepID=A0ABW3G9X3_9NOCA|nr:glycosyltransferase [Williamsia deligens]MCP2193571.1 Glycosyltransferase involved in cell wall bisynthesis [Williamsia deligens]
MRILIVDERVPDPRRGAGFPRAHEIVRALVDHGHRVEMYPVTASSSERDTMTAEFGGAVRFHRPAGVHGLRRLLRRRFRAPDVVVLSRPGPLQMFRDTGWTPRRRRRPAIVHDAEAVEAPRDRLRRQLHPPAMSDTEYRRALDDELGRMRGVDAITTVGPGDRALIESALDVPTYVLAHSDVARRDGPGFAERDDLLFVGRLEGTPDRFPNVDSVVWFTSEVLPILDTVLGHTIRVHLVGVVDSDEVAALASDRVLVHGVVDDLTPFYDRCRVFVAPTRFAAGIPHKVTEAMSEGIPCVITRLLADQLDVDDSACGIADDAEGFARECARLHTDEQAWGRTREAGWGHIETACSPSVFRRTVAQVVADVTRT